jgi:hypothetical protein
MPERVAATPSHTRGPGRSWPRELERKRVQTGVVARRMLAFPARVASTPKMKKP